MRSSPLVRVRAPSRAISIPQVSLGPEAVRGAILIRVSPRRYWHSQQRALRRTAHLEQTTICEGSLTRKRIAQPNPQSEWIAQEVPALRIIDDTLWRSTKLRQKEIARDFRRAEAGRNRLNQTHRRQFLLSGLLVCGICGGGYTIRGQDRYACANHANRGTCANGRTISRKAIEARVLGGLKQKLLAPELLEAFIDEFIATWNESNRQTEENWATSRRELAEIHRRIAAIIEAIESGMRTASMRDRLLALEERKADLERMAEPERMPRLHPKLAEVYRQQVEQLEKSLNDPAIRPEAADTLRSLIDRIVLYPGERRGEVWADLHGELGAILAFSQGGGRKNRTPEEGVRFSVVAGTGFVQERTKWELRRAV